METDKILKLTVSRKPFEVMVTGEKTSEYRKKSKWIESRLFVAPPGEHGNGHENDRDYDFVEIRNGYGKDRPYFIAKYSGFSEMLNFGHSYIGWSNGLEIDESDYYYQIHLGEIVEIGNWEKQ